MKTIVGSKKKIQIFRESCEDTRLARQIERLDNVFRKSGVGVEDGYSKIYVKPGLKNHIQKKLVEQALTGIVTKKELEKEGYKPQDIHQAFKVAESKKFREELRDDQKEFLKFIQEHQNSLTSQIYKGLKLSARKGNSLRNELLAKGLIRVDEQRDSNGWRKYIRLA